MYGGILGALSEAADLRRELGCTAEEAFKIQSERAQARLRELEAASEPETNVLQFRPRER
jgi:hypothetical protein